MHVDSYVMHHTPYRHRTLAARWPHRNANQPTVSLRCAGRQAPPMPENHGREFNCHRPCRRNTRVHRIYIWTLVCRQNGRRHAAQQNQQQQQRQQQTQQAHRSDARLLTTHTGLKNLLLLVMRTAYLRRVVH